MSIFINGMGNISPQQTWNEESLLIQAFDYRGVVLKCVEPEYEEWLDPRQLRRMSRIMKMGITAALMALKEAKIEVPSGIITGTGYGALQDTETFLTKLVVNQEQALNPTPFIQSTHNTIGSTIAMLLQCQGYNQTYTQGAFSFEHALLDAFLHLHEVPNDTLLTGGIDEITEVSHSIQSRFNMFRKKQASTIKLFQHSRKGTVNGEGAAFFLLTGSRSKQSLATIEAIKTFYKPSLQKLREGIEVFLLEAGLRSREVDLILLGKTGDKQVDQPLEQLRNMIFPKNSIGLFKHLCGEYPVASAFAVWLGARILSEGHVPEVVLYAKTNRPVRNVLIVNTNFGTHFSLILLKACRDTI
jgi:3-oxoacyl-[acyl-carrier-protein] synthase II